MLFPPALVGCRESSQCLLSLWLLFSPAGPELPATRQGWWVLRLVLLSNSLCVSIYLLAAGETTMSDRNVAWGRSLVSPKYLTWMSRNSWS